MQYGQQQRNNRLNDPWCTDTRTPPVQGDERRRWLQFFGTVPNILPKDANGNYVYKYEADGTPVVQQLNAPVTPQVTTAAGAGG